MNPDPTLTPAVVIFDLGEVLATPKDLYSRLGKIAGTADSAVQQAYWTFRDEHDRGGSAHSYWSAVLTSLDILPSAEVISELTAVDSSAWSSIRPDAADVLTRLKSRGTPVGILSNAPVELANAARMGEWASCIDHWFFSGELGVSKPDSRIYDIVADSLPTDPSQILFFDDRQVNVDAANRAGWNAKLWKSGEETRRVLSDMSLI